MYFNFDDPIEIKRYGMTVKISARADYDSQWALDGLGEYSNTWKQGAIDLYEGQYDNVLRHDTYHYFIPESDTAGAREWMRKAGYSRHDAYTTAESYRIQDYTRARGLERGDWCPMGIRVEVWHGDLMLGDSTLWGCESDSHESDLAMIAADCLSEAIAEAIKNPESIEGNAAPLRALDSLATRFFRRVYHFGDQKHNKRQNYIEKISRWRKGMTKDPQFGVYLYPTMTKIASNYKRLAGTESAAKWSSKWDRQSNYFHLGK